MAKEEQNPEAGLFSVGEYYLKTKNFSQARYIFSRYLTFYPSGRNASQAANNLQQSEIALAKSGGGHQPAAAPFPSGAGAGASKQDLTDTAKAYYDAMSLISQQKYQQAYLGFKKIVDANSDVEYAAKSAFEIGRCLFLLNKFEDCIKYYTMMIAKYPRHPALSDALYHMGQSYEKNNRKDMAATFYKKILSMPGDEEDAAHVKARRALKALEA